jgi:hypothetical protein
VARNKGLIYNLLAPEVTKKLTKNLTKISDPLILTNRKEPKFKDWLLYVKDKLAANANHYPILAMHLAYVKSCYSGRAVEYLVAYSRLDVVNKYQDMSHD